MHRMCECVYVNRDEEKTQKKPTAFVIDSNDLSTHGNNLTEDFNKNGNTPNLFLMVN